MAGQPGTDPDKSRLRATYRTPDEAAEAARRLRDVGIPLDDIAVNDQDDRQYMLLRQQQNETDHSIPVTVGSPFTPAQAKGSALWGVAGLVTGGILVGILGFFIHLGTLSTWASVGMFAACGALACATAGFTYGGGRQPEVDGELRDPSVDGTISVSLSTSDPAAAERAFRAIEQTGATDAEYETHRGDPLAGDA